MTLGQLKSEWSVSVVTRTAVSKWEHSKDLPLARIILGQCVYLVTVLPSLLIGKGMYVFIFAWMSIPSPLRMSSFGLKKKTKMERWSNQQPSAAGHLCNSTTAGLVFLISSCPWHLLPLPLYASTQSHTEISFEVTITSTGRCVCTTKWHCWRSPVTCFSLLPTGRQVRITLGPQFSSEKCDICPAQLCFNLGVVPGLAVNQWPSLQIKSSVWGSLFGCYGKLILRRHFWIWCPLWESSW